MKTITISVSVAVILGVMVMLVPALVFTYYYPAGVPANGQGLLGGRDNNMTTAGQEGTDYKSASLPTSDDLLQTVPVISVGFIVALLVFLLFRSKM